MKRIICALTALALCAAVLPVAAEGDWQAGYRQLIETGGYGDYLQAQEEEYSGLLAEREADWDSFILYDFGDDSVPELIVRTDYAIEQADVFTWNGESVCWAGTMGGHNFFQGMLWYPEVPQAGLVTLSGGPAMEIDVYVLRNGRLEGTALGRTKVDAEGMDTVGIDLEKDGGLLADLLYGTLVSGDDKAEWLEEWIPLEALLGKEEWERLFR